METLRVTLKSLPQSKFIGDEQRVFKSILEDNSQETYAQKNEQLPVFKKARLMIQTYSLDDGEMFVYNNK